MSRKQYDQASYEYGREAERTIRHWMAESGFKPVPKPDGVYGSDIRFIQNDVEFIAEIERMKSPRWAKGVDPFRFPTLNQLKDRKIGPEVIHIQTSSDVTCGLVSFFNDHVAAPVKTEDNRENTGESIRKLPLERAMPVDLTKPVNRTLEELNRMRVRRMVLEAETRSQIAKAMRALVGDLDDEYGPPYGMQSDEWCQLRAVLESASGLLRDLKDGRRNPAMRFSQPVQRNLF
jgi:hypothetical protein